MEYIKKAADFLIEKYGTRNPFKIITESGIKLIYNYEMVKLKGFYAVINKKRYIVVNGNLDEYTKKIVAAHELGHDVLHHTVLEDNTFLEVSVFNMTNRPEYEASLFAAELLIPDEEILTALEKEQSPKGCASILSCDTKLLGIKLRSMLSRGYNINISEEIPGDFLG